MYLYTLHKSYVLAVLYQYILAPIHIKTILIDPLYRGDVINIRARKFFKKQKINKKSLSSGFLKRLQLQHRLVSMILRSNNLSSRVRIIISALSSVPVSFASSLPIVVYFESSCFFFSSSTHSRKRDRARGREISRASEQLNAYKHISVFLSAIWCSIRLSQEGRARQQALYIHILARAPVPHSATPISLNRGDIIRLAYSPCLPHYKGNA